MEAKAIQFKAPAAPPALRYTPDVIARMKATGVDPAAAESRLSGLPRDQAETTWANVTDYYRRSTDMASRVAASQGADKSYIEARRAQSNNPNWTAFDDMGAQFKNSFVDLAQGVADFIPSTADLAMSALSNPTDDSWYRKWDIATDKYFDKAKYYVSPEAQASVYDEKTGLNWRAVAGMTGSTLGFLATTMIPVVGAAGRAGEGMQALSLGSKALRTLTDPRLQSGAIGYLQSLPGYKEAAINAGYTRNQAALIAPILSTAQAALEFGGADALMKGIKLAPSEAMNVVRQLSKESAAEAFKTIAGKPLTEETFREVINATGKSFFGRLRTPEIRNAILQNVKAGAVTEGTEELMQQGAEAAIQKMADIYYGYGEQGGKGFDPTVKQTAINGLTGIIFGGAIGASMGGMLGRTPTYVGQQTVWGLLDGNVRDLLTKNPGLSLDNNREGLTAYRLTDRLYNEGKLTDQEYQQARAGLYRMTNVSARLAKTNADAPTRFALYNLDSQQQDWQGRLQNEVQAPMQRMAELADERAPGQWFPKPGLSTLDLAEAQDLINQNLPYKQGLASTINQTIEQSVVGLMNPSTRAHTLRTYKPALDALADQWENGPQAEPAPTRPDQYQESDVQGLSRTMDTPDGRFALADTPDGRQVLRVETRTDGQQAGVSEDTDPAIGRFRGYKLPSKGTPVVSLHTIADGTRHDQLLDAFDRNADATESYGDWRERLSNQHRDNDLDGLREAQASYRQESDNLAPDAPDWQRQDLVRKQNWLKGAMASRAADSQESRYGWSDWTSEYLGDQMQQAGITQEQLQQLPTDKQAAVTDALQSGDYQTANQLLNQPSQTTDGTLPATTGPDELSAQIIAATERGRSIENAERASRSVLERAAIIDQIEQLALAGKLDADTEQRLMDQISELERALDEEYNANSPFDTAESSDSSSPQAGVGSEANPGDNIAEEIPDQVVERPQKRSAPTSQDALIERQPQDLHEAILRYFATGGRIRRSDLAHYGDPNLMRGAKGGNPFLAYITGDAKAASIDTLVRSLVEEELGRSMDYLDEQQVIQQLIDTVQSFNQAGSPKAQLIAYQQAQLDQQAGQIDPDVALATARTPLTTLEPLMNGLDRAQVPIDLQDQLINLIAENYVTPDGLDWVGVFHLFRHNQLFEEFTDLQASLLPYLEGIVQQIPASDAELAEESERLAAFMSNEWWNQVADDYQLNTEQYNQLIDDFYGEPITQSSRAANQLLTGDHSLRPDEEGASIPSEGDQSSGEVRASTTDDQSEQRETLTFVQQARVDQVNAQLDADIARLQDHNTRLDNKAQQLQRDLRTRTKTGDLFDSSTQVVIPTDQISDDVYAAFKNDPAGFPLPESLKQAIGYRLATNSATNRDLVIHQNRGAELSPYIKKANATLTRQQQAQRQADLFAGDTSGLEAQDSVKTQLADIERQKAANVDRIANLEAGRQKAIEAALLVPEQVALFQHRPITPTALGPASHQALLQRLQETFAEILDGVQIVDSLAMQDRLATEPGWTFRTNQGDIYGFVIDKTMYLNGDTLNANTPIHEFGHVWSTWAKQSRPDLYEAGIKKATNSPYFEAIAKDPFYQQQADRLSLSENVRNAFFAEEALATAIGDEGEKFVQQAAKKGFSGWLNRIWSAIKDTLGIESKSPEAISAMSLDEFAGSVAARFLEGRPLSHPAELTSDAIVRFSYGPAPTLQDRPARPLQNQGAGALADLVKNFSRKSPTRQMLVGLSGPRLADYLSQTFTPMAEAILQHARDSKVANQLTMIRSNGQALFDAETGKFNSAVLSALANELVAGKYKGSELTGRLHDLVWLGTNTAEPDLLDAYRRLVTEQAIIDEDGNYEWPNVDEENRDIQAALDVYTTDPSDPILIRLQKKLLGSKWASNLLLPETVGNLFSLGEGSSLRRLTKDVHRVWSSRAAEVRIRRNAQLDILTEQLKGLSKFATPSGKIGDISPVKQYSLPGWINGKAQTIDIPVGDWLDIYLTIQTQLSTTEASSPTKAMSSVLADLDPSGKLIPTRIFVDENQTTHTGTYGYQYTLPGEDKSQTLLISRQTYEQLAQKLQTEHPDLLKTIQDIANDPVAKAYVSGLYELENGRSFPLQENYYPTQTWQSPNDRDLVSTVGNVLENARFLQERKTAPAKVVGRDVLSRLSSYANMEERYISNSATRLNLERWRKRNKAIVDNAPKWLTNYLIKLEKDLNDPLHSQTDEGPFEFQIAGIDVGLRAMMKRFSQSTFGFSLTTPLTQFTTAANLYGLGIIETPYLNKALPLLAKLGVDSYNIARQSAKTNVFGRELAEVKYMERLMSNPYMSTIINRIAGGNETYLGQPTTDVLKAQPLDASVAALRKLKNDIADPALRWVRAADRAVVLFMAQASEYQVADQISKGTLKDASGQSVTDIVSDAAQREIARLTEEAVYATNTMSGEGNATPLQRNKSIAGAILGLYSGQQTRLFNSVLQSLDAYLKARAVGDLSADQLRDKAIWTSLNLLVFNSLAVALIHLLYRSLTGLLTGKEPEEDILASLSLDVARGILGSAPSLPTEFIIAASSWVDGPQWEDSILDYAPAEAMKQTVVGLAAAKDYFMADDPETAAKRLNTLTYSLVAGGSNLSGLPAQLPKLLARMAKQEPLQESDLSVDEDLN